MRVSFLSTDFLSTIFRSNKYPYLASYTENAHRNSLKFCHFCPVSNPRNVDVSTTFSKIFNTNFIKKIIPVVRKM